PLYNLTLPNGWRQDPAVVAALAWRRDAALAAGPTPEVERLRLEWPPDAGPPAASRRLTFATGSAEEFPDVSGRIPGDSLDGERRRNLSALAGEATAREGGDFSRGCAGA
ncbi:hypothetical protein UK12_34525, partial [Saccharothrix sp. ST-888]